MNTIHRLTLFCFVGLMTLMIGCQSPTGNQTGSEYMPDMAHSIAYEANYYNYYYNNTWGSQEEYYQYAKPRTQVAGTVPRGANANSIKSSATVDGSIAKQSLPYKYGNSNEGREAATANLVANPYMITDNGIAKGKELYNIYCATCHGEKADGNGYLVRDDGGVYPVQPANLLLDNFVNVSNGSIYHTIMHGKNLMGSYKGKINFEERWQVIHYIRSLQAKSKKAKYNQYENTFNSAHGTPAGDLTVVSHHSTGNHGSHGISHDVHSGHDGHGSHSIESTHSGSHTTIKHVEELHSDGSHHEPTMEHIDVNEKKKKKGIIKKIKNKIEEKREQKANEKHHDGH